MTSSMEDELLAWSRCFRTLLRTISSSMNPGVARNLRILRKLLMGPGPKPPTFAPNAHADTQNHDKDDEMAMATVLAIPLAMMGRAMEVVMVMAMEAAMVKTMIIYTGDGGNADDAAGNGENEGKDNGLLRN